jgi:ABC-type sugar transport system substrate-binding protein
MPKKRPRYRVALALGALALLLAGLITGCGGGNDSTNSSSSETTEAGSSESSSSLDSRLEQKLKPWEEIPKSIAQTTPLKSIPTGSRVAFLNCEAPQCAEANEGFEAAASILGIHYNAISAGASPESFQAAAAQAVREKPDVLIMGSLDGSLIRQQLAQLKAEGVKTIDWSTSKNEKNNFSVLYIPPEEGEAIGEATAQYIVLHHGADSNILFVNQSVYGALVAYGKGIEKGVKADCPECTFSEIDTLPEEVGTKAPSKVVSFLQQNPSTEYQIVPAYGPLSLGLPQALKAAGLNSTIAGSQSGSSNTYVDLKSGEQEMILEIDLNLLSFYVMDAAMRLVNGEEPLAGEKIPWYQLITGKDINFDPSTERYHPLPNYEEEFTALWTGK